MLATEGSQNKICRIQNNFIPPWHMHQLFLSKCLEFVPVQSYKAGGALVGCKMQLGAGPSASRCYLSAAAPFARVTVTQLNIILTSSFHFSTQDKDDERGGCWLLFLSNAQLGLFNQDYFQTDQHKKCNLSKSQHITNT